jgi:hypothetical protein
MPKYTRSGTPPNSPHLPPKRPKNNMNTNETETADTSTTCVDYTKPEITDMDIFNGYVAYIKTAFDLYKQDPEIPFDSVMSLHQFHNFVHYVNNNQDVVDGILEDYYKEKGLDLEVVTKRIEKSLKEHYGSN